MKSDTVLLEFCLMKFDELTSPVCGMGDRLANMTLPIAGGNSPVVILVHCCGMMRRWSSSVNLGLPVPRDREAEFTAHIGVTGAATLAGETRSAFEHDVRQTMMGEKPLAVPANRETFWTVSCHGVLLHVFEELCQHLGQAEITRDFLQQAEHRNEPHHRQ